ncbi:MAG: Na/Pi cotransporter family protein [Eubacterium sp.]|nr:Na/Pi cotransporter family protein [Eubacterium sp.]
MDVISILELFGGVGLFLFGMSYMGQSLERLAGNGLEKILQTLTTSKNHAVGILKGFGLGLVVTGIIQSSSATTIMLIGFVSAGMMKVRQTVPVIFGANIGSCVTAQLLRLGDLGGGSVIIQLLKPSSFAPVMIFIGAMVSIKAKKNKPKNIAGILLGLGVLFTGMTLMEKVFGPLKESPEFQNLFTSFSNPFLGILIGFLLCALIQSSSAFVGILQALSATGSITCGIAIPMLIGQNLGKCITIILGSIGAGKKAKRVGLSYLLFNIIGSILLTIVLCILYYQVKPAFFDAVVNRGEIANLHMAFNIVTALILLPFSDRIADLTGKIMKDSDENVNEAELRILDNRLLSTPGIAINACKRVIDRMGEKILENYYLTVDLLIEFNEKTFQKLMDNESFIDEAETALSAYVIKIDRKRLTPDNKMVISEILNSISDFERIGDYCVNMAYVSRDMSEKKISFSPAGINELTSIMSATKKALDTTREAFHTDDEKLASKIEPLYDAIKEMRVVVQKHHIDRLQAGTCSVPAGVALFDLIQAMERIASHSRNISLHVVKRVRGDRTFDDMHGHAFDPEGEEYLSLQTYYLNKYLDPIKNASDLA